MLAHSGHQADAVRLLIAFPNLITNITSKQMEKTEKTMAELQVGGCHACCIFAF